MKKIPLTQGQVALVDDEDYEELNKFKWCARKSSYGGYGSYVVVRTIRKPNKCTIYMHRYIMNCPRGMEVDHINHNQLDNRKSKLRICTRTQNLQNGIGHKCSSSQYKGVSWYKNYKKWLVQIQTDGNPVFLGYFDNEIEAAKTYDIAARKYFGEFANLNFGEKKHGRQSRRNTHNEARKRKLV